MKNCSVPIIAVLSGLIFLGIAVGVPFFVKKFPEVEYVNYENGEFITDEEDFGDAEMSREVDLNKSIVNTNDGDVTVNGQKL